MTDHDCYCEYGHVCSKHWNDHAANALRDALDQRSAAMAQWWEDHKRITDRLRAEIEAMRPVVEAADKWTGHGLFCNDLGLGCACTGLILAMDTYREGSNGTPD